MIENRNSLIEKLTGIQSSRKSYYLELKEKIAETEKKNTQLQIINQIAKSINVDMTFDEILENVTVKLQEVIAFDRLSLSILEYGKLILTSVVPKAAQTSLKLGQEVPRKNSLLWKIIAENKEVYLSHLDSADFFEEKLMQDLGLRTILLIPLMARDKALGILNLGSKEKIIYDPAEITFMQQLADQLAVVIQNARLYGEVLRSKVEWEETFKAVSEWLILVDLSLTIIKSNKTHGFFAGFSTGEFVGKKCYQAFYNRSEPCPHCPATEAIKTRTTGYAQFRTPSGAILDLFAYPVFNEAKEIYGVTLYIKDVTQKLRMEAQLLQSAKLAAIGEMAAGVAHELNNPLTAILGNAQLLLREFPEEDPRIPLLQDIHKCGTRCKRIIQNLLTFSRQEPFPLQQVSLNSVVEKVLTMVTYQIDRSNINITTDLAPDLPPVLGNSQQLEQILINLLLNARDALDLPRRNKAIQISTGFYQVNEKSPLELQTTGETYLYLAVNDNGKGIPPEDLHNLFNPFFTTKEAGKGTGLGLSVSLGIAKAHQGTITVDSKPGEGATFSLILPVTSS